MAANLQSFFDRELRLVVHLGAKTKTTGPTAEETLRLATPDELSMLAGRLLRADLIIVGTLTAPKLAEALAAFTHDGGYVYLDGADSKLAEALEKTFEATKLPHLFHKRAGQSPKEYDQSYIDRWGDLDFTANAKLEAEQILAHLPKRFTPSTVRVLDVGCLNSYIMESLHRAGVKQVYGTDISYTIAITHNVNPYHLPAITIGDFSDNSYPDGCSDLTICMEVLEHIPPAATEHFIAELARVTSSNGAILISTSEDWEADATHINCRQRPEWYRLFAQAGLFPMGSQIIFPGFNSFVLAKASSPQMASLKRWQRKAGKLRDPRKVASFLKTAAAPLTTRAKELLNPPRPTVSYSQSGEDLLIKYVFKAIGIDRPTYIDVGAHHPTYLSNTALFYKQGCHGINVEPDPALFTEFEKQRPRDINLNIGIGKKPGELDFYLMKISSLNSFSASEVAKYKERGYEVREVKKIHVEVLQDVIDKHWKGRFPDLLTLDVEGLDMEILRSIDYKKSSPTVICVETTTPHEHSYIKVPEAIDFLEKQGYMVYADTFINTIFLKAERWKNLY